MATAFQPLRPDEPLGVVALSGPADHDALERGLGVLRGWGHPVLLAPNLDARKGYLAGGDDARLAGLLSVIDRGARIVVAVRGGYGSTRLLSKLPWPRLADGGIVVVGFSDLTAVINPLVGLGGAVQVHGPMVTGGLADSGNARRLRAVLGGELTGKPLFHFSSRSVVTPGRARGVAMGGNLSVLCSLLGTPWQPDFSDSVLFLEDVREPLYRLDRLLTHLEGSGTLRRVKALISGSLRGCGPVAERSARWRELLAAAAPPGAPVVVDQPFGHSAKNRAFPIGAIVDVDTSTGLISWSG